MNVKFSTEFMWQKKTLYKSGVRTGIQGACAPAQKALVKTDNKTLRLCRN